MSIVKNRWVRSGALAVAVVATGGFAAAPARAQAYADCRLPYYYQYCQAYYQWYTQYYLPYYYPGYANSYYGYPYYDYAPLGVGIGLGFGGFYGHRGFRGGGFHGGGFHGGGFHGGGGGDHR
jgi:uncharacterized membrane protein YgcG